MREYNTGFVEDVKKWLSDANRETDQGAVQTSSDGIVILSQSHLLCDEPLDAHNNENDSCVSEHSESSVRNAATVAHVKPSDSISNVASRTSKKGAHWEVSPLFHLPHQHVLKLRQMLLHSSLIKGC